MLQRPKKQSSNVVITIKYGGLKATQFFSKYTAQAYRQLLADLKELGFPFPKKSNIVFLSHGTLEFFWSIALHEQSHFVTSLVSRVNLPTPGLFKDEQTAMRRQLSIFSLTVREDQNYNPYSPPQIPSPHFSQTSPTHTFPLPKKSSPEKPKNAVGYHPYSRLQPPATSNSNEGHQVSQAKPVSGTARAAETFLDEVGTSLGMVKSESMETVIPRPVPPSYPKTSESQIASQKNIQVKQENSSPKLPWLSGPSTTPFASNLAASWPAPPGFAPLSSPTPVKDHSQTFASTPNVVPSRTQNTNGISVATPASGPKRSAPVRNALTGPAALTLEHTRKSDTVATSSFPASSSHQPSEASALRGTIQPRPAQAGGNIPAVSSPSLLKATPTPTLQQQSTNQLISSLGQFSKKIASIIERQNRMADELDQRKAAVVPPKLCLLSSEDEAATKAKLQEMEKELKLERAKHEELELSMAKIVGEARAKRTEMEIVLEAERAKRIEMENDLKVERTKRTEMENILKDIERECKSPFIVPALLDSFIQISRATTAAINHQASFKMDTEQTNRGNP